MSRWGYREGLSDGRIDVVVTWGGLMVMFEYVRSSRSGGEDVCNFGTKLED